MKIERLNEVKEIINKVPVENDKQIISSINFEDYLRNDLGIDLFADGNVKRVSEILKLLENEV